MRTKTLDNFNLYSFDRFCNHLCQVLLSFLLISDKIKFEWVSQKWKSLIFNRRQKLIISNTESNNYSIKCLSYRTELLMFGFLENYCINTTLFEKVLKKLKFITHLKINCANNTTITFIIEPKVLELFGKFLKKFEIFKIKL
jgi:hypothetical protein